MPKDYPPATEPLNTSSSGDIDDAVSPDMEIPLGHTRPSVSKLDPHEHARIFLAPDPSQAGLEIAPCELREAVSVIGRIPPAHIVLAHQSVSRSHAIIERGGNGYVVRDTKSANGTFVNEFRISHFPVKDGDYVRFGHLRFVVRNLATDGNQRGGEPVDAPKKITHVAATKRASQTMTGFPEAYARQPTRESEIDWGWEIYGRTFPQIKGRVFGAMAVRGYRALISQLSAEGVERLEVMIAEMAASALHVDTHAFREELDGDLVVVIIHREVHSLAPMLATLCSEMLLRLGEVGQVDAQAVSWATSTIDIQMAIRQARRGRGITSRTPVTDLAEFRWIHLSDLHFGAGNTTWRHDHDQVTTALVRDLERDRFAADRVLVTGDVAFSARADQYAQASIALDRVSKSLELASESLRIVPGNHDVDRRVAAAPVMVAMHRYARASPTALDDLLGDPRSRAILQEKLQSFRDFVASLSRHPRELDWRERLTVGGSSVDIWGLCSVWVSDSQDGVDERNALSANLTTGKTQYRDILRETDPAELNIILTHHPLDWISAEHGKWLRSAFASTPSIHLCGHVHQGAGTALTRLGKSNNQITLVAGAGHGEQHDTAPHSYSRCILRRDSSGSWIVGWSPRAYDAERNAFRVDRGNFELDADGFSWFRFPKVG